MKTFLQLPSALSVLLIVAGCGEAGGQLVETTGSIQYEGKPLENATITFQPEGGLPAIGQSDASGNFQLKTRGDLGVSPGPAKVAITAVEVLDGGKEDSDVEMVTKTRSLIPEKYGNLKSSGLTANVEAGGESHFDFKLTK